MTGASAGAWLLRRGARRARDREVVCVLRENGFYTADGRWSSWGEARALNRHGDLVTVTRRRGDLATLIDPRSPEARVAAIVAERLFAEALSRWGGDGA